MDAWPLNGATWRLEGDLVRKSEEEWYGHQHKQSLPLQYHPCEGIGRQVAYYFWLVRVNGSGHC